MARRFKEKPIPWMTIPIMMDSRMAWKSFRAAIHSWLILMVMVSRITAMMPRRYINNTADCHPANTYAGSHAYTNDDAHSNVDAYINSNTNGDSLAYDYTN